MMTLSRRIILQGLLAGVALPASAQQPPNGVPTPTPFPVRGCGAPGAGTRRRPLRCEPSPLPEPSEPLSFDDYRDIRFRPERALLGFRRKPVPDAAVPPRISLSSPGDGERHSRRGPRRPCPTSANCSITGATRSSGPCRSTWALRASACITRSNAPKVFDEVIAFLGASYFRFLGGPEIWPLGSRPRYQCRRRRGGGISAISGNSGSRCPIPDADRASSSPCSTARRLPAPTASHLPLPAKPTLDITATLFPRQRSHKIGLAPLTSMFFRARTTEAHRRFPPGDARLRRPADAIRDAASGSGARCAIRRAGHLVLQRQQSRAASA